MATPMLQRTGTPRLLSSTPMAKAKKHGWVKAMLGAVLGCVLAVGAVFAITNVVTVVTAKGSIVDSQEAIGYDADAIVVLGASVFADGTPSSILQDRLDDRRCSEADHERGQ